MQKTLMAFRVKDCMITESWIQFTPRRGGVVMVRTNRTDYLTCIFTRELYYGIPREFRGEGSLKQFLKGKLCSVRVTLIQPYPLEDTRLWQGEVIRLNDYLPRMADYWLGDGRHG